MALDSTSVAMPFVSAIFVQTGVQLIRSLEASRTNVVPGVPLKVACMAPLRLAFGAAMEMLLITGLATTRVCAKLLVLLAKFPAGSENSAVTVTLLLTPRLAAGTTTLVRPLVTFNGKETRFVPLHLNRTCPVGSTETAFEELTEVVNKIFWFVRAGFNPEMTSETVGAGVTARTPLLKAKT